MARVVNLTDHRPSTRHDDVSWSKVRVDGTDDPADNESWELIATIDLPYPNSTFHSFTVSTENKWVRATFLDEDENEDPPGPLVYVDGPNFQPTLQQVSATLRSRTYVGDSDVDAPVGDQTGIFGADTRPTADQVEREYIPAAVNGLQAVDQVPGFLIEQARRAATLRAAAEIERTYLPEQGENDASNFQTLRMSAESETDSLARSLQWWVLAGH